MTAHSFGIFLAIEEEILEDLFQYEGYSHPFELINSLFYDKSIGTIVITPMNSDSTTDSSGQTLGTDQSNSRTLKRQNIFRSSNTVSRRKRANFRNTALNVGKGPNRTVSNLNESHMQTGSIDDDDDSPMHLVKQVQCTSTGEKEYSCRICGFNSIYNASIRRHVKVVHLKDSCRKFICHLCGKECNQRYNLKSHYKLTHKMPDGLATAALSAELYT